MNYYRYHNAICVNFHVFQTNLCLPQTQMGWTCPLVRCCRPWFSWTCHPSTCNQHRTPKKKKNRGFWYKQNHLPNFHFSDFSLLFRCVLVICNDVYIFAHIFFVSISIYIFIYSDILCNTCLIHLRSTDMSLFRLLMRQFEVHRKKCRFNLDDWRLPTVDVSNLFLFGKRPGCELYVKKVYMFQYLYIYIYVYFRYIYII